LLLRLVGGVAQHRLAREAGAWRVIAHHVVDRQRVGDRLDSLEVESAQAFDVLEDGGELRGEGFALGVAEVESGELGDVADVDGVVGHRGGSKGKWRGSGKGGMRGAAAGAEILALGRPDSALVPLDMRRIWIGIGVVALGWWSPASATPQEAAAARKAYENAVEAWRIKIRLAEGENRRRELVASRPDPAAAARRMWRAIGGSLDQEWALDPAAWFLRMAATAVEPGPGGIARPVLAAEMERVREAVAEHHLSSEALPPMCMALVACADQPSLALLRRIEEESPHSRVSGVAALGLAMMAKELGDDPKVMSRRLNLLRKAIIEAAEVEVEGVTVADLAKDELYIIRNLSKGQKAPELEGVDSGGRPMKLSDHAGKVVMLVFWNSLGEGPGGLFGMVDAMRADPRFAGGDFEVVGVNGDPTEVLRRWQKEGMVEWPNFSDPDKELAQRYRVGVWPLVYVLGRDRTIHYVGAMGTFAELTAAAVLEEE